MQGYDAFAADYQQQYGYTPQGYYQPLEPRGCCVYIGSLLIGQCLGQTLPPISAEALARAMAAAAAIGSNGSGGVSLSGSKLAPGRQLSVSLSGGSGSGGQEQKRQKSHKRSRGMYVSVPLMNAMALGDEGEEDAKEDDGGAEEKKPKKQSKRSKTTASPAAVKVCVISGAGDRGDGWVCSCCRRSSSCAFGTRARLVCRRMWKRRAMTSKRTPSFGYIYVLYICFCVFTWRVRCIPFCMLLTLRVHRFYCGR